MNTCTRNYMYIIILVPRLGHRKLLLYFILFIIQTEYLPPPFLNARYGNLHTLPRPTAYPTQVRMNSSFPPQFPRCSISFSFISVVDFMGSVIKEKGAVESFDPSWPNFMGSVIRESGALASFSPL